MNTGNTGTWPRLIEGDAGALARLIRLSPGVPLRRRLLLGLLALGYALLILGVLLLLRAS